VDLSGFKRGVVGRRNEQLLVDIEAARSHRSSCGRSTGSLATCASSCGSPITATGMVARLRRSTEPFDTSTPIGRAIVQVLAVFAELEAATIGMRVASARDHAARHGTVSPGGRRGLATTGRCNRVPAEAEVIREVADRWLRVKG